MIAFTDASRNQGKSLGQKEGVTQITIQSAREEPRVHIHVYSPDGEAKFWLEPTIELANNYGLSEQQINQVENIIGEREDEIRNAWQKHFPS